MQDPVPTPDIAALLNRAAEARQQIAHELAQRVYGQSHVVDLLLIALFARGHTLMMGVPGLAKTLLVSTLAQVLDLRFNRIQFTPDLMPSDITGTDILQTDPATGQRSFQFLQGPVFCNLLLADEINRTPPKTQAALLQAMQESQVTVGGRTYPLEAPFLVFATQNPIEQEGTYPLPEAQLDRFMFHVQVDYPDLEDERKIARLTTGSTPPSLSPVLSPAEILQLQAVVRAAPVSDAVVERAVQLVRATRPADPSASDTVRKFVAWGAGPRASQFLILGAKARAVLQGYETPSIADVDAIATAVLRHRVMVNFLAEAEGMTSDRLVADLVKTLR